MRSAILLAAALLSPQAAAMPVSAQAQSSANEPLAEALLLAQLMMPRDLVVEAEMAQFDLHFKKSILNGQTQEEADGDYPGLTDALVAAARPLVARLTERGVSDMHNKVAGLIENRLDTDEIAELTRFYRSPAGKNVIRLMAGSVDASALYKHAVENPDEPVTRQQITEQIGAAAKATTEKYSDADEAALFELMKRPVFAKLAGLQPAIRQMLADAHNETDPDLEAEMAEAMASAVSAHIARLESAREK